MKSSMSETDLNFLRSQEKLSLDLIPVPSRNELETQPRYNHFKTVIKSFFELKVSSTNPCQKGAKTSVNYSLRIVGRFISLTALQCDIVCPIKARQTSGCLQNGPLCL